MNTNRIWFLVSIITSCAVIVRKSRVRKNEQYTPHGDSSRMHKPTDECARLPDLKTMSETECSERTSWNTTNGVQVARERTLLNVQRGIGQSHAALLAVVRGVALVTDAGSCTRRQATGASSTDLAGVAVGRERKILARKLPHWQWRACFWKAKFLKRSHWF